MGETTEKHVGNNIGVQVAQNRGAFSVLANRNDVYAPVYFNCILTLMWLVTRMLVPGLNDNSAQTVTLRDDGTQGDGAANDGVYGYQYTPSEAGIHYAVITADGTYNSQAFTRISTWSITVASLQTTQRIYLPMIVRRR